MNIIVDLRNTYKTETALSSFTREFWYDCALAQTAYSFFFIIDRPFLPPPTAANLTLLRVNSVGLQWFNQLQLNKMVRRLQANRLIVIDKACAGRLFLVYNNKFDDSKPQRSLVFAGAPTSGEINMPVVSILQPALQDTLPSLAWAAAESIKTQYTGGRSFFLFVGAIDQQHQLIELLKAFSLFKKWQ